MTTVTRDDGQPAAGQAGTDEAVACTGLTYRFGDHLAVNGVSLRIRQGETFGLLGPNGAGKTTTIRMLTTLLKPASGSVCVFGVDAASRPMLVRRMIGYVPQMLSADGMLTGRENVELFARLFDVPRAQRAGRVADALAAMGLSDAADRVASTYSGGMIRRLELAQALVNTPRLLVLDEPTVGLDPIARTEVWEYITGLRDAERGEGDAGGMTVLMTTHYMDEADTYCDRIALMHQGTIRAEGTPADLKAALSRGDDPPGSPRSWGEAFPPKPPRPPRGNTGHGVTLDDVFRHYTGDTLEVTQGGIRDVRRARRTARRLG